MEKVCYLGGFNEFNPEEPNVNDGDVYLFYSRSDKKLHIGKFFKADENGSWGFFDYFTNKRHYPYTSEVISLEHATLKNVSVELKPVEF